MTHLYWIRIKEFFRRWWGWLVGALALAAALSAARRAESRLETIRDKHLDLQDEEIGHGWDEIEGQHEAVDKALEKARQAREKAAARLDRIAVDRTSQQIISDWNARNRQ